MMQELEPRSAILKPTKIEHVDMVKDRRFVLQFLVSKKFSTCNNVCMLYLIYEEDHSIMGKNKNK